MFNIVKWTVGRNDSGVDWTVGRNDSVGRNGSGAIWRVISPLGRNDQFPLKKWGELGRNVVGRNGSGAKVHWGEMALGRNDRIP